MRLLPQGSLTDGRLVTLHAQFLDGRSLHQFVITDEFFTPLLKVKLVSLLNGRMAYLDRSLAVDGVRRLRPPMIGSFLLVPLSSPGCNNKFLNF